jgi:hypothetical protein
VPTGGVAAAGSCTNEAPPVTLSGSQSRAVVTAVAPVPAMYDISLMVREAGAADQRVTVAVDGRPVDGVLSPSTFAPLPYGAVRISPTYLTAGPHAIQVDRVPTTGESGEATTLTLKTLHLNPRYPDAHTVPPARLGSIDPGYADLAGGGVITGSWKWYGHNFSFYHLSISGSATGPAGMPIDVSVDGRAVGLTTLNQDGGADLPLVLELANGATHTITLRGRNPAEDAHAKIYAVQLAPYHGPQIYAATSMRWPRKDNGSVRSEGSSVIAPAGVRLTRTVSLAATQRYEIQAHVRYAASGNTTATLHLAIDGWDVAEAKVPATSDSVDAALGTFLPSGAHDVTIWWTNDSDSGSLRLDYVTIR